MPDWLAVEGLCAGYGEAIVIPFSPATRGHGSHTIATLWKDQLAKLLEKSGGAP